MRGQKTLSLYEKGPKNPRKNEYQEILVILKVDITNKNIQNCNNL